MVTFLTPISVLGSMHVSAAFVYSDVTIIVAIQQYTSQYHAYSEI